MFFILIKGSSCHCQPVSFTHHNIFSNFDGAFDCYISNIDGDDDNDIVACGVDDNTLGWWENDGTGNFTTHILPSSYLEPITVYAADMDNDSDVDILCGYFDGEHFGWWENDGVENFNYHMIDGHLPLIRCVYAVDLDQDDDLDVLIAVEDLDLVAWYENNGNQNFSRHNIISHGANDPHYVTAADLDNDEDLDVVAAFYDGDGIVCWENDGLENFTPQRITTHLNGPWVVTPVDLNQDGHTDLLSSGRSGDIVAWAENLGFWNFQNNVIGVGSSLDGAKDACAADFDFDDDLDIVVIAAFEDQIIWGENDGWQNFQPHIIASGYDFPYRIQVGDMDGDFDIDIVSVAYNDDVLDWWENTYFDSHTSDLNLSTASQLIPNENIISVHPNPFNPSTTISFDLPEAGQVSLKVYDVMGREVAKLFEGYKIAGTHEVIFDAKDLVSGMYFIRLEAGKSAGVKKILLLK